MYRQLFGRDGSMKIKGLAMLRHALVVAFAATASSALAGPSVDFVLLSDASPSAARSAQHWIEMFSKLGVDGVQIRSARPGEKVGIETRGFAGAPSYRVTGQLSGGAELILPGGSRFGINDTERLSKWIDELGKHGSAGVTEKKGAFGLLPEQTATAREGLKATLDFATKGASAEDVLAKVGAILKYPLTVDTEIQQAIAADGVVRDELQGLSAGTALAALVRPVGGVLRPREAAAGSIDYLITKGRSGMEAWPVGWPSEQPDGKIVPQLIEAHNIEIRDVSLSQTVAAIQSRFRISFLWDHNAILKDRIDVDKKVSFPNRKAYYVTVLRQLLAQDELNYHVRVDEAGKPLIWITTYKSH
jgi:hypothetical protein